MSVVTASTPLSAPCSSPKATSSTIDSASVVSDGDSVDVDAGCEVSADEPLDEREELPSEALSEDELPVESTHPLDEDQS